MAKINVYEPPDDPSSRPIETATQPDGTERQVVRVPESDLILGTIRDLLVLEDFASQTTLEAARALLAHPDFAARTVLQVRQRQGLSFMASSGRLSLSTSGFMRATFTNPVGGRTAFIHRLVLFASSGPVYGRVLVNPATGLPTVAPRPANNSSIGHPITSQVQVRIDTSTGVAAVALAGGVDTGLDLAVPPNTRETIELPPLSVPPGVTVGINVPFTGASDAVLTAYWYEES